MNAQQKRELQAAAATVRKFEPHVQRLVTRRVPARRRVEGRQVARLGVLVAFTKVGRSLTWRQASRHVHAELRRWEEHRAA